MRHRNRTPLKPIRRKMHSGWAPVTPMIINLIYVIILAAAYYFVLTQNLFPDYQEYILIALKILIVIQILLASVKTLIAPILSILLGGACLYLIQNNFVSLNLITINDAWGIIIAGIVGLLITIVVKSARRY